jgi:hypothetical protein
MRAIVGQTLPSVNPAISAIPSQLLTVAAPFRLASMAKSQLVREALADYHSRIGRLSEGERKRMLKIFDALVPAIPARPRREGEDELREIRRARRSGGRLSQSGKRQ